MSADLGDIALKEASARDGPNTSSRSDGKTRFHDENNDVQVPIILKILVETCLQLLVFFFPELPAAITTAVMKEELSGIDVCAGVCLLFLFESSFMHDSLFQ